MENHPRVFLVLLISNLILLWPENAFCVIAIILNVPNFVLWPRTWPILVNVPRALEKKCTFFMLSGMLHYVKYSLLVDGIVQVFYVFVDFLRVPSIFKRWVEIPNYDFRFVFLLKALSGFASCGLSLSCLMGTY